MGENAILCLLCQGSITFVEGETSIYFQHLEHKHSVIVNFEIILELSMADEKIREHALQEIKNMKIESDLKKELVNDPEVEDDDFFNHLSLDLEQDESLDDSSLKPINKSITEDREDCVDDSLNELETIKFKKEGVLDILNGFFSNSKNETEGDYLEKCSYCEKECSSTLNLNLHIKEFHQNKLENKEDIDYHENEEDKEIYSCNICNTLFENKKKLSKHVKEMHEINKEPVICSICRTTFQNRKSLDNHLIQIHGSASKKRCPFCEKDFKVIEGGKTSFKLRKHLEQVHVQENLALLTDIFGTQSKSFQTCEHCGYSYRNKGILKNHKIAAHPENVEKVPCHICGILVIDSKRAIWSHLQTHENHNYPCSHCGKLFKHKANLTQHEANHMERQFSCEECGAKLRSKAVLNRHIEHVHRNNIKRVQCEQCDKRFIDLYRLKIHVSEVHDKAKHFPCEVCGFMCARISNLNLHRRKVHKLERKLTKDDFQSRTTYSYT